MASKDIKIMKSELNNKKNKIVDVKLKIDDKKLSKDQFIKNYVERLKHVNLSIKHNILTNYAIDKWNDLQKQLNKIEGFKKTTKARKRDDNNILNQKYKKISDDSSYSSHDSNSSNHSQSVNDSQHNDVCEYCERGGELLLCDTCSGAYHFHCLKLSKQNIPKGLWQCPLCIEEINKFDQYNVEIKKNTTTKQNNEDICFRCSNIQTNIQCNKCFKNFHSSCAFPPLKDILSNWTCPYCNSKYMEGKLETILFWKNVDVKYEDEQGITRTTQIKKFLIKYHEYSYWEVDWVDEFQLKISYPAIYGNYCRRYDLTKPMYLEETQAIPDTSDPTFDLQNITENDLFNTYYIYGIKPEWLQIHRIIKYSKTPEGDQYLVRWCDLPYNYCTWEFVTSKHLINMSNLYRHIKKFKKHVSEAISRPDIFTKNLLKNHSYKPYENCPHFISSDNGLKLHDYQLEGLNWIRYSCFNNTNVILADEMGLGKTIQSITFLYSLYKEKICAGPFLIVAPLSTLPNWEREFELWAPDFYVVVLNNNRDNREIIKDEEIYLKGCTPKLSSNYAHYLKFHVMLVSYEIVQIESPVLKRIKWAVLVLDEAHRIKNKVSKLHTILTTYKFQFKLLLTGTPLQNNLEELFFLLNFLDSKNFSDVEKFILHFKDLNKEEQIDKIHKLLGKRLLRRLKSDVLKDLPVKCEVIVPVVLSPLQKKYYKAILTKNYSVLIQKGSISSGSSWLNIIMELKKCCNHPYLFKLNDDEEPINEQTGMHELSHLISGSSKMVLLEKLLAGLYQRGNRVLIFSQMTKLLDLIEEFITIKDYKYERIDGSIPSLERQLSIDRFNSSNSDSFIFLLSTRAGGLGINLASADTVIIYDSDWNPHNDIQALSRAHRLGQLKKVMIYRFVTRNSIEERILEVAKQKMMLTHLVVQSGMGKKENFTKRELDDILRFGTKQLFENSNDDETLEYDDIAIEKLLNRDIHTNEIIETGGINEYFSSFKVIDCAVKQQIGKTENLTTNESSKYWETILKDTNVRENEVDICEFGKGKRRRKEITYVDPEFKDIDDQDSEYNAAEEDNDTSSTYETGESVINEESSTIDNNDRNKHNIGTKKDSFKFNQFSYSSIPVDIEAELKRKKMVLSCLIRYGFPPLYDIEFTFKKWKLNEDPTFTLDDFKLFLQTIFISLDTNSTCSTQIIDKFPLDEFGRQSILTRLAMIELIKTKAISYAINLPYLWPLLLDERLITKDSLQFDYMNIVSRYINTIQEGCNELSHVIQTPQTSRELELTNSPFYFNIEDYGYTDLHIVWDAEQAKRSENLWWRFHDLWLCLGIAIHGYNEFGAIFNDPRFDALNLVFVNRREDKNNFVRRRLDLLEQALLIEDVIKRMTESKVFLKPESNIVKLRNKVLELDSFLHSLEPIVQKYSPPDKVISSILIDVLQYTKSLTLDIKSDFANFSSYIMSSSLRTTQLFPKSNDKNQKSILSITASTS